jgi:5-formyltetrahydrofolate cyclo-ligase
MIGSENAAYTKWVARNRARQQRKLISNEKAANHLIENFPRGLSQRNVAGFAPIGGEINLWPLLHHLRAADHIIGLPVAGAKHTPLTFRRWSEGCEMACDQYGIEYPRDGEIIVPKLILVPLLAFTAKGDRLGYGGGYYDRTLASLRRQDDIFACGVAYAAQEVASLPTDDHDERLDGILTEDGFRRF